MPAILSLVRAPFSVGLVDFHFNIKGLRGEWVLRYSTSPLIDLTHKFTHSLHLLIIPIQQWRQNALSHSPNLDSCLYSWNWSLMNWSSVAWSIFGYKRALKYPNYYSMVVQIQMTRLSFSTAQRICRPSQFSLRHLWQNFFCNVKGETDRKAEIATGLDGDVNRWLAVV